MIEFYLLFFYLLKENAGAAKVTAGAVFAAYAVDVRTLLLRLLVPSARLLLLPIWMTTSLSSPILGAVS